MNKISRVFLYAHPLLFNLLPPLFLYQHNQAQVLPVELNFLLGIAAELSAALYVLAWLICRRNSSCAALLATYWSLAFIAYPALGGVLPTTPFWLKIAAVAALCLIACLLGRRIHPTWKQHAFWLMLSGFLVAYNGGSILLNQPKSYFPKTAEPISEEYPLPDAPAPMPHIVYIVPDRYPSKEVLLHDFHFDNRPFLTQLTRRGFHVADVSFPNYFKTFLSVSAVFNMQYLDFITREFGPWESSHVPVQSMLLNHEALKMLHTAGYHSLQMASWWGPTRRNPYVDENFGNLDTWLELTEFQRLYADSHPLGALYLQIFSQRHEEIRQDCDLIFRQRQHLFEAVGNDQPQFVFWHLFLPHPPFIYDRNGVCPRKSSPAMTWENNREGFIDQLQFANHFLLSVVDGAQMRSRRGVIFVIQSDEGPFPWSYIQNQDMDWHNASTDEVQMKFGNLNAIYFPSRHYDSLKGEITPINNFRHIMNEGLGMHMPLLPHHVYLSKSNRQPYQMQEITEQLIEGRKRLILPPATPMLGN